MSSEKIIPTSEGLWLWFDGSARGRPVLVHDPFGNGLQFDRGASSSETNLAAFDWGGRLVLEGADEKAKAAAISRVVDVAALELERLIAAGTPFEEALTKAREAGQRAGETVAVTLPAGATIQGGGHEHVVEGGPVGVSCLDSAEYLNTTPAGACRRVTETSGGESLTFEDDRRLPAASEVGASELAKLEAIVRKIVDGNFGAGKILIGGLEVYVADPRYTTATRGGINVSVSSTPRAQE